jgi:hypothetical protein
VIKRPWDDEPFMPLPKTARPNDTFYTTGKLAFGDQPVEYGYMLQSHTDGDIYAFFPEENVLVTGGVICSDGWPLLDWWTGGWMLGVRGRARPHDRRRRRRHESGAWQRPGAHRKRTSSLNATCIS